MMNAPSLIRRSRSNTTLLPVCAPPQAKSSSSTMRVVLSLFGVALMCFAGLAGSGTPGARFSEQVDVVDSDSGASVATNADAAASARLLSALVSDAPDTAIVSAAASTASAASAPTAAAAAATGTPEAISTTSSKVILSAAAADVPCADSSATCERWAQDGECTKNAVFMTAKCTKACGLCVEEGDNASRRDPSGERLDKNNSCNQWAQRGECASNPSYMLKNCPAACASAQGHDES